MGAPKNKGYKRSWKNLLLNKRYQLRFTLFMVGLSALLMAALGWWVMREARKATTVGVTNVLGKQCPDGPGDALRSELEAPDEVAPTDTDTPTPVAPDADADQPADGDQPTPEQPPADAPPAADGEEPAVEGEGDGAEEGGERRRRRVVIEKSEIKIEPAKKSVPDDFVKSTVSSRMCHMEQVAQIKALHAGHRRILYVLIAVGLMLMIGLALYGIKMTHKVAGPLHKVTLYFGKMRDGRFDTVYNLRKGDQLVEFYDHFKLAHNGVRKMQEQDIEHLREVIEVAEKEDLASKSPEIAAAIDQMRETLARKEKSLE
jgi:hypothetical protein